MKKTTIRYEARLKTPVAHCGYPDTVYPVGHVVHKNKTGNWLDRYAIAGSPVTKDQLEMVEIIRTIEETEITLQK